MENIDKTINKVCNWIEENLDETNIEILRILPEMTVALAKLLEARAVQDMTLKARESKTTHLHHK